MKLTKDINFLPDYVVAKEIRMKRQLYIISLIILFTIVFSGFFLIPEGIIYFYEKQEEKLNTELMQLSKTSQNVQELNKIEKALNEKKKILRIIDQKQNVNGKSLNITKIVSIIEDALPFGIILNNYSISEKKVVVSVSIDTPLDTIDVIKSLEDIGIFEKVTINSFPIVDKTQAINISLELK